MLEYDKGDPRIPHGPHGIIVPALTARFLRFLVERFVRQTLKDEPQAFKISVSGNFASRKQ
ncbi:MAG: hypothetical protein IMX03_06940 [Brockia lithotrophica]|uniref:Uncharacterized protein n=1 Tax=Hydrogenibacillus schlegelii TaxID=1484 RepID=A0A2T5G6Q4_HYDSH|nr:hypothetical protein [Hydrogenibacillus schlegelii]MBE3550939.1 hypothetical protein [Brockia lithotrophica]PTQ51876.1 MAG: hypothetical protein HSCHL_0995 [Hydrogenibacillus schlegelii]